jgi:drug/metabolite transporter, DME family
LKLAGAGAGVAPLVLGASRIVVAAPLLVVSAAAARASLRPAGWILVPAGACMAGYQLLYFSAVPRAGVAATALVAIWSAPLFVTALAWPLLRERPDRVGAGALLLGALGGALLVAGSGRPGTSFTSGAVLALGGGLVWALYIVLSKRARQASTHALAALTFSVAAVMLSPFLVVDGSQTAALWRHSWPLLLYLAIVPTALAYWLYTRGLRRVRASSVAVVGLLEPLTATALGLSLFGEHLSALGWVGAALLLAAVTLLGRSGAEIARDGPP